MMFERKLRKIQDNIRNSGWRIQHIPWQTKDKLEYFNPQNNVTKMLMFSGFACFIGPIFTLGRLALPVWVIISIMIVGLLLLMASRFSYGRNLFGKFEAVEAICIDREVQEFEDPDSVGSFTKNTFWAPRILCEFDYHGTRCRVTPIIVKTVAFSTKESVNRFLKERIDSDGICTLWVNPKNPLHTVFHKKPRTGPYTV